jgi:tetratricopeptide (TPR) repeat protein
MTRSTNAPPQRIPPPNGKVVDVKCAVLALAICLWTFGAAHAQDADAQFRDLLREDDALDAQVEQGSAARLRRLDAKYRAFLRDYPKHVRAMIAYGSFLYDQQREEEGITWWEKAIATDPHAAHAFNNLANHYAHNGHAADALRYYQKAYELEPNEPMFRFNWATTCVLFRTDTRQVYGWDNGEIFRRGLEQFRNARDLSPRDYSFSSAYAETFYMMKKPDWQEAYAAWKFCLEQPLTKEQQQGVFGHLARTSIHLARYDEAKSWIAKMTADSSQSLRRTLERKLAQVTAGPVTTSGTDADGKR